MKKFIARWLAAFLLTFVSFVTYAQNIQLHYDLGRNSLTSTVEMFRPDDWGSTFFFVDFDYNWKASGAYWEISRELCFWQESQMDWLSLHLEYNGGLSNTISFNNAFLGGLTYSGHSADWDKTWSLSAMYKAIPGIEDFTGKCQMHNFQLTGVWDLDFLNHWISFNGFADFWRESKAWGWLEPNALYVTEFVFIAEPQLWVNLKNIKAMDNINLSVGTEMEVSCNFVEKGFRLMPTLATKWTF